MADDALFCARLMAYASLQVGALWSQFAAITAEFDSFWARQANGAAPIYKQDPAWRDVDEMHDKWRQARDYLPATIRSELRKPP